VTESRCGRRATRDLRLDQHVVFTAGHRIALLRRSFVSLNGSPRGRWIVPAGKPRSSPLPATGRRWSAGGAGRDGGRSGFTSSGFPAGAVVAAGVPATSAFVPGALSPRCVGSPAPGRAQRSGAGHRHRADHQARPGKIRGSSCFSLSEFFGCSLRPLSGGLLSAPTSRPAIPIPPSFSFYCLASPGAQVLVLMVGALGERLRA
jgi:hypothetical protein